MVDSGVQEGSCYFANSASDEETVEHGYLLDEDETLGKGDFLYDLSRRKIIQCELSFTPTAYTAAFVFLSKSMCKDHGK